MNPRESGRSAWLSRFTDLATPDYYIVRGSGQIHYTILYSSLLLAEEAIEVLLAQRELMTDDVERLPYDALSWWNLIYQDTMPFLSGGEASEGIVLMEDYMDIQQVHDFMRAIGVNWGLRKEGSEMWFTSGSDMLPVSWGELRSEVRSKAAQYAYDLRDRPELNVSRFLEVAWLMPVIDHAFELASPRTSRPDVLGDSDLLEEYREELTSVAMRLPAFWAGIVDPKSSFRIPFT